jgi:hypothetical protein
MASVAAGRRDAARMARRMAGVRRAVIIAGCSDRKLGRKQGTTLPNEAHAPIARGHEIYGMTQTKTQTGTKSGRRWGAMLPSVLLLAGLLGMVAANKGLRQMFAQAVQTIDPWAVVAVLPVQFVAVGQILGQLGTQIDAG